MARKKPPKGALDRVPLKKLASGIRKQLLQKLEEREPGWKSGKSERFPSRKE
jgi:hypothetical protein